MIHVHSHHFRLIYLFLTVALGFTGIFLFLLGATSVSAYKPLPGMKRIEVDKLYSVIHLEQNPFQSSEPKTSLTISHQIPSNAGQINLKGAGAMDAELHPDGSLYVLNSNNSVSIIEGTQVVENILIPVGSLSRLTDLAIDPETGDVFVSQWFFDQVYIIRNRQLVDVVTRQTENHPPDGIENGPLIIAPHPGSNIVYVATAWDGDPSQNGLTVFEILPNLETEILTHLHTGGNPQAVEINPSNGRVYVANALDNTISVVSGIEMIMPAILVGSTPTAIGIDAFHGLIYVANRDSGDVSIISESNYQLIATVPTGAGPISIAVDETQTQSRAYVVNKDSNTVTVITGTLTSATSSTLSVGTNPLRILRNPTNGLLYVANQQGDSVSILNGTDLITTVQLSDASSPVSPVALELHCSSCYPDTPEVNVYDGVYVLNFQNGTISLIQGNNPFTTTNITDLPLLSHTAIAPLPDGDIFISDFSGRDHWILAGLQVSNTQEFSTAPLSLWDSPTKSPLFDPFRVAHDPLVVDPTTGSVYIADHHNQQITSSGPVAYLRQTCSPVLTL